MKTIILAGILALFGASARAQSTTTRLGLSLPSVGQTGWGPILNNDFSLLDAAMVVSTAPTTMTSSLTVTAAAQFGTPASTFSATGDLSLAAGAGLTIPATFYVTNNAVVSKSSVTVYSSLAVGNAATQSTITASGSITMPNNTGIAARDASGNIKTMALVDANSALEIGQSGLQTVPQGPVTFISSVTMQYPQVLGANTINTPLTLAGSSLTVVGAASFGNAVSRSTFNASGSLVLPNNTGVAALDTTGNVKTMSLIDANNALELGQLGTQIVPQAATTFVSTVTIQGAAFSVGGSNLSVDANQFSTSKPLTVSSSGTFVSGASTVLIASGTASDVTMTVGSYGAAGAAKLDIQTLSHEYFWQTASGISDDFRLYDQTNAAERVRVTKGGNMGIGTASPLAKLSVSGDSSLGLVTAGSSVTVNAAAQFGSGVAVSSFVAAGYYIPTGWTSTQLSPAGAAPAPGVIGVTTRNSTINDLCISTGTAAGNWALMGSKGVTGCF